MSTGRQVKFEDWDNKRQRVRGSSDEANAINDHLQLLRTRLYDKENELLERGSKTSIFFRIFLSDVLSVTEKLYSPAVMML